MNESRQYLKHGKALCGKVFGGFVDTFNWLVDFATNLKGDADVNDENGHVYFDRSDAAHPVIRCKGCSSTSSGTSQTLEVITSITYTPATRSLTYKKKQIRFTGEVEDVQGSYIAFTATPLTGF